VSLFDSNNLQTPKQLRAQKTLQDIVESTEKLIKAGDIESVTSENLSALSGYSVGGIFHYFKKRDDIFVHLFMIKRQQKIAEIAQIIRAHSPQADINSFITELVNVAINTLSRFRLKIIQYLLRTYFRRAKNPESFDALTDIVMDDWMRAINQDQTNTFALMDKDELMINIKAFQMAVRTPFFEGDPIAGTEKHKRIAINIGVKLFGKSTQNEGLPQ